MADLVTHNYTRSPAGGRELVVFEASDGCERPRKEKGMEHWLSVSMMASSAPVEQHGRDIIYQDITMINNKVLLLNFPLSNSDVKV